MINNGVPDNLLLNSTYSSGLYHPYLVQLGNFPNVLVDTRFKLGDPYFGSKPDWGFMVDTKEGFVYLVLKGFYISSLCSLGLPTVGTGDYITINLCSIYHDQRYLQARLSIFAGIAIQLRDLLENDPDIKESLDSYIHSGSLPVEGLPTELLRIWEQVSVNFYIRPLILPGV